MLFLSLGIQPTSAGTHPADANVLGREEMIQDLDEELQYLREEQVVTSVRHKQPISESPSNIYVITAEDIRPSGVTNIPTLLPQVPDTDVMQTTGGVYNVSVRGKTQLAAHKLLIKN